MSIILSDLFESSKKKYQLKLIAGADGLNTPIHWVQFTEDIETTHFLKGGELIFITGMTADSDHWLFDFSKRLIHQKSGGVVLNIGRYFSTDDISEDVIALCNQHHLPFFTMPWKIHLATIMHDYIDRIFKQSYQEDRTNMAFQHLLLHPRHHQSSIATLNSLGFETTAPYLILVCKNLQLPDTLNTAFRQLKTKHYQFQLEDLVIIIVQNTPLERVKTLLDKTNLDHLSSQDQNIFFGIGDMADALLNLPLSYEHALFALKAAQARQIAYLSYDDLGLFKLFFAVKDTHILSDFYHDQLSLLEAQDQTNKTSLTKTLRLYLECDGSIQAVAEASFTHRNTVNYRMKKIRTLLNIDLFSTEEKFNLRLAFLIKDFLSI